MDTGLVDAMESNELGPSEAGKQKPSLMFKIASRSNLFYYPPPPPPLPPFYLFHPHYFILLCLYLVLFHYFSNALFAKLVSNKRTFVLFCRIQNRGWTFTADV